MRTKSKWSPGPGVNVLGISLQNDGKWAVSAVAKPVGTCPDCCMRSRHRHGWRKRTLQDLSVQGQVVNVQLTLSRWQCRHRECQRRTFTDRLPDIAAPYTRRTARMAAIVDLVGYSMGGRPAEHLMGRLGMPVSDDTILRQIKRRASVSIQDAVRVVGIDDWSWRRSTRYGTIMVDLERRAVVDILDDRSVASAKAWLQARPSIEVVSRDSLRSLCPGFSRGRAAGPPGGGSLSSGSESQGGYQGTDEPLRPCQRQTDTVRTRHCQHHGSTPPCAPCPSAVAPGNIRDAACSTPAGSHLQ